MFTVLIIRILICSGCVVILQCGGVFYNRFFADLLHGRTENKLVLRWYETDKQHVEHVFFIVTFVIPTWMK